MRRIFELICILLLLGSCKGAEELIFFADDYYKAVGNPKLVASAVNPIINSDNGKIITIVLANNGWLEELIAMGNSSSDDAAQELIEEMRRADAINVNANITNNEMVKVVSGAQSISFLPSGSVALLNFSISAESMPEGWQELFLEVEYEHQVDVSVFNGVSSPLYQLDKNFLPIRMLFESVDGPLKVLSVKSDLHPGGEDLLLASIKNMGLEVMENSSARLIAAPPFRSSTEAISLGDIKPGDLVVATLPISIEDNARPDQYELSLHIMHRNGTVALSIPLTIRNKDNPITHYWFWLIAFMVLVLASAIIVASSKKRPPRRSLRRG
ncbi:MAG: hypothetical protein MUO26_03585 [Methanotrichaceae archaeon]|nr:hypothetical protein [Methanotrichaceae archaeon]